jgi:cell wall-associated NlpC family hydrolase
VEHLAPSRPRSGSSRHVRPLARGRTLWRAATLFSAIAAASMALPARASTGAAMRPMPSMHTLLQRARALSDEIDSLNQQYDGLSIQLAQARSEELIAQHTYRADSASLSASQLAVGQLAAQSYMNGGLDSMLQVLTSSDPATIMDRASILQQVQQENSDRVSQLARAVAAAQRAHAASLQEQKRATELKAEMAAKRRQANAKIAILNSAVFRKAMAIFQRTGQYPSINLPTANTIGAQALRWALTRRGDPYVWGAAGPNAFDCSGLVMWAYAKVGISLPHYTGAQWNMGIHVSRNDLQPGDLVFFYPDIGHVGLYIGNGLMVDAPDFGEVVQVQPVMWSVYVGAVRIVG